MRLKPPDSIQHMKRIFVFLLSFGSLLASAQTISFAADTAFNADSNNVFDIPVVVQLTNNSSDTLFTFTRIVQTCDLAETAFCDQTLCYGTNQSQVDVVIHSGESFPLKVYFYPGGQSGCCKLWMRISSRNNPANVDSCLFRACTLDVNAVDAPSKDRIAVYPNPANDRLMIETLNKQPYSLLVHDILGRVVLQMDQHLDSEAIDVSALPKGVYVIRTQGEYSGGTTFEKM